MKAAVASPFFTGNGPDGVVARAGQGYFMAWLAQVEKLRVLVVIRAPEGVAGEAAALPPGDAEALGRAVVGTLAFVPELAPPPAPAKKGAK
ncbi:MAG: hypothetical protein QM811_14025 [Pirellulales bacterium]